MNGTTKEIASGAVREIEPELRDIFTRVVERDPHEAVKMLEPYPDEFVVQMLELGVLVGPLPEVGDVARHLGAEVLELLDDRRHDLQHEEHEHSEGDQVDEEDREPAWEGVAAAQVDALDAVDGGVERQRQERRREDPAEGGAHVKDHEQEQGGDGDHTERDRDDLYNGSGLDPGGVQRVFR